MKYLAHELVEVIPLRTDHQMNILVLDRVPSLCAHYHVDRDVSRHLLDVVQALYAAHYFHDGQRAAQQLMHWHPSSIDAAHPTARWTRINSANYNWTVGLLTGLLVEFEKRNLVAHAYAGLLEPLKKLPLNLHRYTKLTPFFQGTPLQYRSTDAIDSYRRWYFENKKHLAHWTAPASKPRWWVEMEGAAA